MNGTLPFYEYRLSGGDTQTIPAVIESFELFALRGSEDTKTSCVHLHPTEPPGESFTK